MENPDLQVTCQLVCLMAQGAGIISLFHFQGSARIAALVEHVIRGTPTGKQILMCVEDLALDAGMYGLRWNMPFPKIKKWIGRHS